MPSPTPSLSSIFVGKSCSFAGQSPALSHGTITVLQAVGRHLWAAGTNSLPLLRYHYRGADEDRIGQELSHYEAQWGDEHPKTLDVLLELGEVLLNQGGYRSAEEGLKNFAACCRAQHGEDSVGDYWRGTV